LIVVQIALTGRYLNQLLGSATGRSAIGCLASASISPVERRDKASQSAAADAEALRVQRLREDARRSLSVNLSEGIALSHKLLRFTGAALKN
jgi:hypothetical protein